MSGLAGCGLASSSQDDRPTRGEASYVDNSLLEMKGPPPTATVAGSAQTLDVVAIDWKALGGEVRTPGSSVTWARRGQESGPVVLTLSTSQLPIRVVAYAYAEVGADGVPKDDGGQEHRCETQPGSWCSYAAEDPTRITLPSQAPGTYLVVQAAWITASGTDVQLSYAWQQG